MGTAVVWLSPGMPRSVAPSGMPEPTTDPDGPDIVPPTPDIDAAPEPLLFEDEEPQLFDRPDPPPSKAEFELVLGHGIISGLTPGVLISVEPSGMPPRPGELSEELPEDGAPSGEVGPMPGVVVVCACAATIHDPTTDGSQQQKRISHRTSLKPHRRRLSDPSRKVEGAKTQTVREWGAAVLISEHGRRQAGSVALNGICGDAKANAWRRSRFRPDLRAFRHRSRRMMR